MDHVETRPIAELTFLATDGSRWIVREFAGPGAGLDVGAACLVFEGDGMLRRVKTFPSHWNELAPEELMRLSWTR